MTARASLIRDDRAAGAAEFALILPLLLLLLFGLIDAGRFIWEYNRAEKATQMGVRYAVATNLVPSGLASYSFAVDDGITAGETVPTDNFDYTECDNSGCDPCVGGDVCGDIGYDSAAFAAIVTRMDAFYPPVDDDNVIIEYRNVGLGYSGDPNGPDVAPLVTVWLEDLEFTPITTLLFGLDLPMPVFRAALTLEDGAGTVAN